MELIENKAKLAGFRADLAAAESKLAHLDVEREETLKQIDHLKRIISNLAALCGEPQAKEDLSTLGFTDACRVVIRDAYPNWITAVDIRDALPQRGYDLAPYTNPLASIYTILRRLEEAHRIEKKEEGLKTVYRWKRMRPLPGRRGLPPPPSLGEVPTREPVTGRKTLAELVKEAEENKTGKT